MLGPQLTAFAARHGTTVAIHQADAYSVEWPADARWDVAWHDIWPTIAFPNLIGIARIQERYLGRVRWQDSWALDLLAKRWEARQRKASGQHPMVGSQPAPQSADRLLPRV